jgi:hypothetical protein
LNMIEANNGQALSTKDNRLLAPKGSQPRYTAETVLRTRSKTYRKIVYLLADPYWSVLQISKACRVSEHTVRAIRAREAVAIAERKKTLAAMLANVAELGAERMEATIGKASLRDAAIGTGVAVDKMLALVGQSPVGIQIAYIAMPSEEEREARRAVHQRLDEIARRLRELAKRARLGTHAHAERHYFSQRAAVTLGQTRADVLRRYLLPVRGWRCCLCSPCARRSRFRDGSCLRPCSRYLACSVSRLCSLLGTLRSIPPEAIFSEAEQNTVARGTIAAGLVGTSAAAWDRRLAEEAAPGVDNLANS